MKRIIKLLLLGGLYLISILSCEENQDLLQSLDLEQTEYELDAREQTIDIKVLAGSDIEVESYADWIIGDTITIEDNKYVHLEIAGNDDLEKDRTGIVNIKLSNTDIAKVVKIVQKYRLIIQTDRKWYDLTPEQQTFDVLLERNSDEYEITISEEGRGWLSLVSAADTKAITQTSVTFAVTENEDGSDRLADIFLSIPKSNVVDTVHVIQKGYNSMFLPSLLRKNPNCQIFYQALCFTGLRDTLEQYLDPYYPGVGYDSTYNYYTETGGINMPAIWTSVEKYTLLWPEKRQFKYTLFVVPDSILNQYGIYTVDDLRTYAESIYPWGASLPDNDRSSSLNQLISYHILPCQLTYDQLNTSYSDIVECYKIWDEYDIEDFYETLLPHSIMRISTPKGAGDQAMGIYINRKGTVKNGLEYSGTRIATPSEHIIENKEINTSALNGSYHYVDGLLTYGDETRYGPLITRIRVTTSTLSPDFINSGAHSLHTVGGRGQLAYKFLPGYCKNVYWSDYNNLVICPRYKYFPLGEQSFIRAPFDIAFKLPSAPCNASYEIRILLWNMMYNSSPDENNIVQFSLFESSESSPSGDMTTWNWVNCGDPVDLAKNPEKWVSDDDVKYEGMTDAQREEAILADDNALRESGYMKAMDTYWPSDYSSIRNDRNFFRIIVTQNYLNSNKDYYLRLKSTYITGYNDLQIAAIEIVPKDIYAGMVPEDRH